VSVRCNASEAPLPRREQANSEDRGARNECEGARQSEAGGRDSADDRREVEAGVQADAERDRAPREHQGAEAEPDDAGREHGPGLEVGQGEAQARDRHGDAGADAFAQREQQSLAVEELLEDGPEAEHGNEQQRVARAVRRRNGRESERTSDPCDQHDPGGEAHEAAERAEREGPRWRVPALSLSRGDHERRRGDEREQDGRWASDARAEPALRREQTPHREQDEQRRQQLALRRGAPAARGIGVSASGRRRHAHIMGQRPLCLSTWLLVLALAVCASTARVASASPLNWEGTLSIEVLGFPPLAVTGGGVSTLNGPGDGVFLETLRIAASRGGVAGSAMFPITDPVVQASGIASLRASASLASGSLAPISGGSGATPLTRGVLPVRGLVKVCLLSKNCTNYLPLLFTQPAGAGPGAGVKGVGVGGLVTVGGTERLRFSIEGAPWTLHTATVSVAGAGGGQIPIFASGFVHGAASLTGSTGLPGGALQLVTPIRVRSNQGSDFAAFGRLGVRFIPEPGVSLLLAAGCFGLGVLHLVGPPR
jgi:hypothetical protein